MLKGPTVNEWPNAPHRGDVVRDTWVTLTDGFSRQH